MRDDVTTALFLPVVVLVLVVVVVACCLERNLDHHQVVSHVFALIDVFFCLFVFSVFLVFFS